MPSRRSRISWNLFLACWLLVAVPSPGCTKKKVAVEAPTPAPGPSTDQVSWAGLPENTRRAYLRALEAAKFPSRGAISTQLLPLLPGSDGLVWDGEGRILMVSWTKLEYFQEKDPSSGSIRGKYRRGEKFPLFGDTWFTAAPLMQRWCRNLGLAGEHLALRLRQRIGLPPNDDKTAFLQVWIRLQDIFRPCPDPEISDRECQVEIPVLNRNDQKPWDCRLPAKQVSGKFVKVNESHLAWMCRNWESSYGGDSPDKNYPWTALGYTYDWGNPDDHRGASEFVVLGKTEVVFESISPTAQFCQSRP